MTHTYSNFYVILENVSVRGFHWFRFNSQEIHQKSIVHISLSEARRHPGFGEEWDVFPAKARLTLHNVVPAEGNVQFAVSADWTPCERHDEQISIPVLAYMTVFNLIPGPGLPYQFAVAGDMKSCVPFGGNASFPWFPA